MSEALRVDYAGRMLRASGIEDAAVARAMAAVRREDFLGPPPWTAVFPGDGSAVIGGDDIGAALR